MEDAAKTIPRYELVPPFARIGRCGWKALIPKHMETDNPSDLCLLEDNLPFGYRVPAVDDVSTMGLGRFAYLDEPALLFSTPDNTDPGNNGSKYSVAFRTDLLREIRQYEKSYASSIMENGLLEQLGAGNFYTARVKRGALCAPCEYALIEFIFRKYRLDTQIVEIGAGWGQVEVALGSLGYYGIGFDVAPDRVRGANHLLGMAAPHSHQIKERVQFLLGDFPRKWNRRLVLSQRRYSIAFFSNLGLNRPEEFCDECILELVYFDEVIMDIVRFWRDRRAPEEQQRLVEKLSLLGFQFEGEIFSSADTRLVRFSNSKKLTP